MFPKHCNKVSLRKVRFPLTKESIIKESVGKVVYYDTDYIILTNEREWAVTRIENTKNPRRFKKIEKIEIISLPKDTGFVRDPTVNVNSPSTMARIAEGEGRETVVVIGKFEHISFISNEKPVPLVVFDFAPPNPPKLIELVERALYTTRIQKPIRIAANILDLNKLAKASENPFVMFPCHMDDSDCGKNVLFLEETPSISSIGVDNITLIGCDASLSMFSSVYGKKPAFINICPFHRKETLEKREAKCIARCCNIGEGHLRIENTAFVNWDPKLCDVEEAILDLFELKSVKTSSYKTLPALKLLFNLVVTVLRHISQI